MTRRNKPKPQERQSDVITALSHEGRGITRINGKTIFIRGALPGEIVRFETTHVRKQFEEGTATTIQNDHPHRVAAICPHFTICGGCSLQHLDPEQQLLHKQSVLLEQLRHQGDCQPSRLLPALSTGSVSYRSKARLGVRFVPKKGGLILGFREHSNGFFLVNIDGCPILDPRFDAIITPLKTCLSSLSIREHIPQLEFSAGDERAAIILRTMQIATEEDLLALQFFSETYSITVLLQPKGPNELVSVYPEQTVELLEYSLPEFDCRFQFYPTSFTQVNAQINRKMVSMAISLLAPNKDEDILELFCGLGNFSLPMARQARSVTAIEGDEAQVLRARLNAELNSIQNTQFITADLSQDQRSADWAKKSYAKLLLDPSRAGADAILELLPVWKPSRIVYISCNPATLSRDAKIITSKGYTLTDAGVMDMFPHTAHVESIAVFERR